MLKLLWQKKVFIIFLAFLVVLLPISMSKQAGMLEKTIVLSIGIDKVNNEYLVVVEANVNDFDPFGARSAQKLSAVGENIPTAIENLGRNRGQTISFSHTVLLVIGSGLAEENVISHFDYFVNKTELSNNTTLLFTRANMEEIMDVSIEAGDNRGGLLQQIAHFNQRNLALQPTSIERFYTDYLRMGSSGVIPIVGLEDGVIKNTNTFAVFTNGAFNFELTQDESIALRFADSKKSRSKIMVEGTPITIVNKRARTRISRDGVVRIRSRISAQVDAINAPDNIARMLEHKIYADLMSALERIKEHDADYMQYLDRIYAFHRRKADTNNFEFDVDIRVNLV